MRGTLFSPIPFCLALSLLGAPVATIADPGRQAQPQRPPSPLDRLPDDAAKQGPLLLLIGGGRFVSAPPAPEDFASVDRLAEKLGRRVVTVGNLRVLAPTTMRIIEDRPDKPDPYAGLRADERLKVLLSLFTSDQWQLAGSAGGIGAGDMDERERALYLGLLPDKIVIQRTKLTPTDQPNVHRYESQGDPQEFDPADTRLRLVRKASFGLSKEGSNDYGYGGGINPELGEEHYILPQGGRPRGDGPVDPDVVTAFGVPILRTVPSRLKPGQLDFTSPALQASVSLDGEVKTLGELLARAALATRLDLVADKRLMTLPVFLRVAPGQSVRAGNLLQGLCWSVTGVFRRVGASTFLLTDDVQGIGARIALLNEWAEEANSARYKALQGLGDAMARHDPLSHIGFAPNDPRSLPPDLLQRIDAAYRQHRYNPGPEVKPSDLPEALQRSLESIVQFWGMNNTSIRTDRVRINTELAAQFVFPGGEAVEAPFSQNLGSQLLQEIAVLPKGGAAPANAAPPAPPQPMPATLPKRVLLAQLPEDDKALIDLLATAKSKGFNEVWLHLLLDDPKAPERLQSAVAAGKKIGIRVGGAVSLLRGGGVSGQEDLNILGETGAQFAKRRAANNPELQDYYGAMSGWIVLDPNQAVRLLTPLTRIQGLSSLTLRATAAPGWAGDVQGGDGIPTNGHLGYGVATRLACIRTEGFDPLDVAPYSYSLRIQVELPFFPDTSIDGLWHTLNEFRLNENRKGLIPIHAALRQAAPGLPLYLDDRASPYTDPHVRWYGRWAASNLVPVNPVFSIETMGREAAFVGSSEPLLCRKGRSGNPAILARALGETAQQATKDWSGVALDLIGLTPPEALRMLGGLPTLASKSR
ncbi:MAG TPA: hypothetical protein VKU00_01570 [Chthonomonadaceae bacterium]|nr:hypothetical protein [Chthonomonadaceae bacterium]